MSPEFRANFRTTVIIILADLAINIAALFGYNEMRQTAMHRASSERITIERKLDAAWLQREHLVAQTAKACR